jgi:hypothetical protein
MYTYIYTCTYTDIHAYMYIHLHILTYTYGRIHPWACMYTLEVKYMYKILKYLDIVTNIYSLDRSLNICIYIYIHI